MSSGRRRLACSGFLLTLNRFPYFPHFLYFLFAALLVAAGYSIYLATRHTVFIDGREVLTHARTVGSALRDAGIEPAPGDQIDPPLDAPITDGLAISLQSAPTVFLQIGSQTQVLHTWETSPFQIVREAGVELASGDQLWADGIPLDANEPVFPRPPHTLKVLEPIAVTVVNEGGALTLTTTAPTVGQALWEAGLQVYLGDGVTPPLDSPVTPGLKITLDPSTLLTISLDGRRIHTRTYRRTVGEVLDDLGVVLVGEDYAIPDLLDPIPVDEPITVIRVEEQVVIEQAPIKFDTLWQAAAEVELDQRTLMQAGLPGVLARRQRVRLENGLETTRTQESEWTMRAPAPQIIGYGTGIVVRVVDTADGPLEYWRAARFYATSYSPARSGTPRSAPWYGRTRSGKQLAVGMAAVDTNLIPLGTRMYVPGYGFVTAEDTGSGIRGKIIDLGYDDASYKSWHQYVTVYFLAPVPPADQIIWIWPK